MLSIVGALHNYDDHWGDLLPVLAFNIDLGIQTGLSHFSDSTLEASGEVSSIPLIQCD